MNEEKYNGKPLWHRRHKEWEPFDRITIDLVERYKTSGLSGDEWRFNACIEFWFKGEVVHRELARDITEAAAALPYHILHNTCPIPERIIQLEKNLCDQPGCKDVAVGRFVLKRLTSRTGEYLDPAEEGQWCHYFRKFCAKHLRRGDCSREDADANYIAIDAATADDSTNTEASPSAVIYVDIEVEGPGAPVDPE